MQCQTDRMCNGCNDAVWYLPWVQVRWRFTHNKDMVPSLPPQSLGFHHVSQEVGAASWARDVCLLQLSCAVPAALYSLTSATYNACLPATSTQLVFYVPDRFGCWTWAQTTSWSASAMRWRRTLDATTVNATWGSVPLSLTT